MDKAWAEALKGVTLSTQIAEGYRAYYFRQRHEDVETDTTAAIVVACDRCDAQPLAQGYSTLKGDLCINCAAEIRAHTHSAEPPSRAGPPA